MARISASIPEDLKDELYQKAIDAGLPISHIIVEALRNHLNSPHAGAKSSSVQFDSSRIESRLDGLTVEIRELKEQLASRTPPKGVRYF